MKFNAIVGNPPYQVMDGGGTGSSAVPVYNHFVSIAKRMLPNHVSMIMPSKWFSGGRGLDDFRDNMLTDKRTSLLVDYSDSRDCFPGVDIAGGVCYFLWSNSYSGPCNIVNISNGSTTSSLRSLNEFPVFIRHDAAVNIIHKVLALKEKSMEDVVYSSKPFGFRSYEEGRKKEEPGDVRMMGSQGYSYVTRGEVKTNADLIDKWKVIMSKASAEHAGQTDKEGRKKVISRLLVLEPNTICTESYLMLSAFDDRDSAENLAAYARSLFFRFLMSTILLTQNIAKDKFVFIPVQDWSILWTDSALFKKYGFTKEEIAFIESQIKPMGDDSLFDSDDLLDPEFGNFNLEECGVKPGNVIVYTPVGIELTVAADNKVICNGELYSLAQFTAKYMPRNKRSVSGVCQGPRYFSYNGISLYKLKESFLGGQK